MSPELDGPLSNFLAITPNDSADITFPPDGKNTCSRALICGAAGTVTIDAHGHGTNVAIPVTQGYNPIMVTRIYATGTDVTTIVAGW